MWKMTANRTTGISTSSTKTSASRLGDMRHRSNWSVYSSTSWNSIWLRSRASGKWWKGDSRHWIPSRVQARLMGSIRWARRYIRTCRTYNYPYIGILESLMKLSNEHDEVKYGFIAEIAKGKVQAHSRGMLGLMQQKSQNRCKNHIPLPRLPLLSAF